MKRYTVLVMKNGGRPAEEGDVSSALGLYAETCRILLQVVKHSVRRKIVDKNLHLVYALIYHQRDFNSILRAKFSPFTPADTEKIKAVMTEADNIVQDHSARTAEKAMDALKKKSNRLKGLKTSGNGVRTRNDSGDSVSAISDSTMNGMEDFKFTYEEEADPETFFIPYVWEVIVSTVTSSSLEWDKSNIKVFALVHHVADAVLPTTTDAENGAVLPTGTYAEDAGDVV
eukprot:CAMPEP_0197256810 /NCGR_PEP_ID=MMETSP1429-20130617/76662_1 /TAXON_ID=49237 /ORGANISM="Chaetoceros  sp., Strain UNC1202" /LENGTH=228 /DNA_ID=CAMNT_0042720479 /DNA_START=486 /DNA_END=1172 /DNA_ORIENTATION=-